MQDTCTDLRKDFVRTLVLTIFNILVYIHYGEMNLISINIYNYQKTSFVIQTEIIEILSELISEILYILMKYIIILHRHIFVRYQKHNALCLSK